MSESRHIELFDSHQEYVSTSKGEFVDKDGDEFVVYKTDILLHKPLQSCSIKFLSLRSNTDMWLYGLQINLIKLNGQQAGQLSVGDQIRSSLSPLLQSSKLDIQKISERLQESHHDVSDKARRMMGLVSGFQKMQQFQQMSGGMAGLDLLGMMSALRLPPQPLNRRTGQKESSASGTIVCCNSKVDSSLIMNETLDVTAKSDSGEVLNRLNASERNNNNTSNKLVHNESTRELTEGCKSIDDAGTDGKFVSDSSEHNVECCDASESQTPRIPDCIERRQLISGVSGQNKVTEENVKQENKPDTLPATMLQQLVSKEFAASLRCVVREEVEAMEARVMGRLETRLAELAERQDRILHILQNKV